MRVSGSLAILVARQLVSFTQIYCKYSWSKENRIIGGCVQWRITCIRYEIFTCAAHDFRTATAVREFVTNGYLYIMHVTVADII